MTVERNGSAPEETKPAKEAPDSARPDPAVKGEEAAKAKGGDSKTAPDSVPAAVVQTSSGAPQIVLGKPLVGVGTDSNTRLLLTSVAVLAGIIVLAWGGAKVACNAHPPMYQPFQVAAVEQLTESAKGAALEFHHALNTLNFARAREVAKESANPLVVAAQQACDPACSKTAEDRASEVKTRAVVLDARRNRADVRAESFYQGQKFVETYVVSRDGKRWFVEDRLR